MKKHLVAFSLLLVVLLSAPLTAIAGPVDGGGPPPCDFIPLSICIVCDDNCNCHVSIPVILRGPGAGQASRPVVMAIAKHP